ncbi:MAG: HyaD/HybD family hydrogenase maturation endopeptidase [bacterium]
MSEILPRLILGVGNILLKDEGIGVHTARKLQTMDLPSDVEILDGGTLGLSLLPYLEGRNRVILIDAIQAEGNPGDIYRFSPEGFAQFAGRTKFSFHQTSFFDVIQMAEHIIHHKPDVMVIAIQPKDISPGMELSPEIEARIPALIRLVMEELNGGLNDVTRGEEA